MLQRGAQKNEDNRARFPVMLCCCLSFFSDIVCLFVLRQPQK